MRTEGAPASRPAPRPHPCPARAAAGASAEPGRAHRKSTTQKRRPRGEGDRLTRPCVRAQRPQPARNPWGAPGEDAPCHSHPGQPQSTWPWPGAPELTEPPQRSPRPVRATPRPPLSRAHAGASQEPTPKALGRRPAPSRPVPTTRDPGGSGDRYRPEASPSYPAPASGHTRGSASPNTGTAPGAQEAPQNAHAALLTARDPGAPRGAESGVRAGWELPRHPEGPTAHPAGPPATHPTPQQPGTGSQNSR